MTLRPFRWTCLALCLIGGCWQTARGELLVGAATADITPKLPVALDGQFYLRIAKTIETPLEANVIAIESRRDGQPPDLAVMVSCDLVYITKEVLDKVREKVRREVPDLITSKIFLNATHTHTAPVTVRDKYPIPKEGVTQVGEYCEFLAERVAGAIAKAWKSRATGSVTWGLGHAVIAYNR
ncbi:MAG TPA: hypothetical protein EYP14_03385, partial [Planctomycetaceae bacterium]|nr:hypothetical protein [Planctomycetaceae bacterium]